MSDLISSAPFPKRRGIVPVLAVVGLVVIGLGIGGLLAWRAFAQPDIVPIEPRPLPTVHVEPPPVPVEPTPTPPEPLKVTFTIETEPPGAMVKRNGELVGTAPVQVTLPRDGENPVTAQFDFTLDGYQPASVRAQGLEGNVPVKQTLKKVGRPGGKRPKPDKPDGYKDDPYQ